MSRLKDLNVDVLEQFARNISLAYIVLQGFKRLHLRKYEPDGLRPVYFPSRDRVLNDIPKTPASAPGGHKVQTGSYTQDQIPQTPVTPVSTEGVTSLQKLIQQDVNMLDETSTLRLQMHLQKLTNAVHLSFAERALLDDNNQFLA